MEYSGPPHLQGSYVVVYIIDEGNSESMRLLFSDSTFVTHVVAIDVPKNYDEEAYRFRWCLRNSLERYPNSYTIVVKGSSVSSASPQKVAQTVMSAKQAEDWHICYLCKWQDQCQRHEEINPYISKTYSPWGAQALLFTPEGRDVFLGERRMENGEYFTCEENLSAALHNNIECGNIKAICVNPNLIFYSGSEYEKRNECASKQETQSSPSFNGLWILLLIVAFVLFFLWLFRNRQQV